MAGIMGGHLVGMSTTLEAIAAREAGMEILGISLVTNLAAGLERRAARPRGGPRGRQGRREPDGRPAQPGRHPDLMGAADLMRVLVTGAAGSLGRVITVGLAEAVTTSSASTWSRRRTGTPFAWHEADCADGDAVEAVFGALSTGGRLDAVVHLAGVPEGLSLPDAARSHVTTTAALLDAMVAHRVDRIVYASSNHAVGRTPRAAGELTQHARPRPDTYYGVAKVAAEALLQLFADRYGIDAVACRIGSFLEQPASVRGLSTWLSYDDGVRMVEAALTTPAPGFAVVYGISANTRAWWDLEPGRRLGYEAAGRRGGLRPTPRRAGTGRRGGGRGSSVGPSHWRASTDRRSERPRPSTWSALQVGDWCGDQP